MAEVQYAAVPGGTTVKASKRSWKQKIGNGPELPFFFYVVALLLHTPIYQQYIYYRMSESLGFPYSYAGDASTCGDQLNSTLKSLQSQVQARSSYFSIGVTMCNTLSSVVVCLFLGSLSDKIGRQPIIALGISGGVVELALNFITMYLKLPLWVLYIGAFVNGLGGYFTGLTLAVMAYVADTTEKDKRALRLGIIEAVVFAGAMIGNFSSGHLLSSLGFQHSYAIALSSILAALFFAVFFMKESLPNPERSIHNVFNKECFLYPKRVWRVFRKPRPGRWKIGYMLGGALMINLLTMGVSQVMTLYVLNSPFCWPSIEIGYFLGARFLFLGMGAVVGIKVLGKFLAEHTIAFIGIFSYAGFYSMVAFAKGKWMLYLACIVCCIAGTVGPIFRGILSKTVGVDEQGSLFSIVASFEMTCVFVGSFIFNSFYPYANQRGFPGATFLLIVGFLVIPLILNGIYVFKLRKEKAENDTNCIIDDTEECISPVSGKDPVDYGSGGKIPSNIPEET